jgi:hypothetical protein
LCASEGSVTLTSTRGQTLTATVGDGAPRNEQIGRRVTVIFATSYPFLNILWTMIIFFAWVIFIWIAVTVLVDVFRREDLSGWGKAGWTIFIIVLPFLGVLVYLIANHAGMNERKVKDTQAAQTQFDDYVRQAAGTGGAASEIEKAKQLLDSGAITQPEFDALKAKALA